MERNELEVTKTIDFLKLDKRIRYGVYAIGLCLLLFVLNLDDIYRIPQLLYPLSLLQLIVVVPVVVLHELAHGLAFKTFGKKIKFGFKLQKVINVIFYTTSPGSILPRKEMIFVALAPQIMTIAILSILFLLKDTVLKNCLLTFAAFNLASGCADIYMAWLIARQKGNIFVEDTGTGAIIYKKA